ncbi:MAG: hypothetical protein ACKOA2_10280 [Ilumatobacteraceae bacterium]
MNRKIKVAAGIAVATVLGFAATSQGASPHFASVKASVAGNGDLVINVRAAGLGSNSTVTLQAEGYAEATWGCINRGGKNPGAENKRTEGEGFDQSGVFTSGRNGSVKAALVVEMPEMPNDLSCPGNMTTELLSVTYSNLVVTEDVNGLTANPNDVSRSFYP